MNYLKKLCFVIFLILISYPSFAQKEGDRILAIVGNDIILESDLQYQLQLYARQNQLTQITPAIAQQIFQQMLIDKIIYAKAEQDSIIVKDDEINKELEYRIKNLIDQVGSEQRVQEIYGMSIAKIKMTLREDLIKKLKADKLKRKKFQGGIHISDTEVKKFYSTYRDSIPPSSEEFELSHIFIIQHVTEQEKLVAKNKILQILDSIKNGADFSEMARLYSEDPGSAKNGGDLGWNRKGNFVKEFEEAAFSLQPGQISEPVETVFGYHLIKVNEKKGNEIQLQHILITFPHLPESDLQTISLLKDIKKQIESNQITFEEAAKKYSQDPETNQKGGYIGFVSIERLDSNVVEALKKTPIGSITEPLRVGNEKDYGYEILKLISINPPHKLTLESDYERIKKMALMFKENEEMNKWIEELKKFVYVDVKF